VAKYFDTLRFKRGEVFPFERITGLMQDNVCKINNIKYSFPYGAKKGYKNDM